MHEIGQESVPTSESDTELFTSLRLAEPSERVNISLDERMLTIQGRRSSAINVRVGAIDSVQHHSSNLVPNWLLMMGLVFIWIGWRLMIPPTYRWSFMLLGGATVFARIFTRQPTVTVQTASNDTHVLFGNEHVLRHLTFMVNKLLKGKSIAYARLAWNAVDRSYHEQEGLVPAPELPVVINAPVPIDMFLSSLGEDEVIETVPHYQEQEPEWMPTHAPEPSQPTILPSFLSTWHSEQAAAERARYPADHHPVPVHLPVLEPQRRPPMHQEGARPSQEYRTPQPYLPSFIGQDEVHIPQRTQEPMEEEEEPLLLDAELIPFIDTIPDEDEVEILPLPRQNITLERERPLLQPRKQQDLARSSFRPRHRPQPRPRTAESPRGFFGQLRKVATEILSGTKGPSRPSPYGTSNTSSALREQAQQAHEEQTGEVLRSLASENGGVFGQDEMDRLQGKIDTMLATVGEMDTERQPTNLDDISFADLKASVHEDDRRVRQLDD
ncbi:MAG: hypothetical protein P8Q40_01965 [Candidatus Poseidonia sp.]|uniref:hypothetical protein n=1 Tax=Poseidonia sp. TaxID=2666344 RepID=UPI0030BA5DBE|nr:hypothetical protein [Poseidonia sp.]